MLEQSNGTSLRMDDISTPAKLATLIRLLLESVGQNYPGLVTSIEIKISPSSPTTDIILTALCARNLVTGATMVVRHVPSRSNPSSTSTWSKTSNPNTSSPSPLTSGGTPMSNKPLLKLVVLSLLLGASAGFLAGETMTRHFGRPLPTTPKGASPTYLMLECFKSGESADANYSCKFMMPSWSNIQKTEKTKSCLLFRSNLSIPCSLNTVAN